jgi:hypothetical protein
VTDERIIVRVPLEPFDDLLVDVDLFEAIRGFHGEYAGSDEIGPVYDALESDRLRLRALSPLHFLTVESEQQLWDSRFIASHGNATVPHQKLVALARLYLESLGKIVCVQGASGCAYAGGFADACVPGEEYFVECGSMRPNKPREAMRRGQTLLLLPYENAVKLSDVELDRVVDRPPQLSFHGLRDPKEDDDTSSLLRWIRKDYVQLAFELRPTPPPSAPSASAPR